MGWFAENGHKPPPNPYDLQSESTKPSLISSSNNVMLHSTQWTITSVQAKPLTPIAPSHRANASRLDTPQKSPSPKYFPIKLPFKGSEERKYVISRMTGNTQLSSLGVICDIIGNHIRLSGPDQSLQLAETLVEKFKLEWENMEAQKKLANKRMEEDSAHATPDSDSSMASDDV